MKFGILHGDGNGKNPYYLTGYRNEEKTKIVDILSIAEREGIDRVNVAYSGIFYIREKNGSWYLKGENQTTYKVHGIPENGIRIK